MDELPLVSPLERAVFLRAQPYLAGLQPAVIAVLASHTHERRARAGEVIYDAARSVCMVSFIVEGRVRTLLDGATLFDIEAPGGVGIAHGLCRNAAPPTAVAVSDSLLLQIELGAFVQILEDHFPLVLQMARILGRLILESERVLDLPSLPPIPISDGEDHPSNLDLVQRLSWARRAPIFRDTNLSVLAEVIGAAAELRLEPGEWLWREGDAADSLALVIHGILHVEGGGRSYQVGSGRVVGFAELFAELPRGLGARCEEACVLLCFDRSILQDAMEDHFDLTLDVMNALCTRHLALRAPLALRGDTTIDMDLV